MEPTIQQQGLYEEYQESGTVHGEVAKPESQTPLNLKKIQDWLNGDPDLVMVERDGCDD